MESEDGETCEQKVIGELLSEEFHVKIEPEDTDITEQIASKELFQDLITEVKMETDPLLEKSISAREVESSLEHHESILTQDSDMALLQPIGSIPFHGKLNKAPKTSAERAREFRARKALLKQQSRQQQEPDAIVEIARTSEIRTLEKRAKRAEATRRWRERKKGVSSKKQAKTTAQRMREYRERKKFESLDESSGMKYNHRLRESQITSPPPLAPLKRARLLAPSQGQTKYAESSATVHLSTVNGSFPMLTILPLQKMPSSVLAVEPPSSSEPSPPKQERPAPLSQKPACLNKPDQDTAKAIQSHGSEEENEDDIEDELVPIQSRQIPLNGTHDEDEIPCGMSPQETKKRTQQIDDVKPSQPHDLSHFEWTPFSQNPLPPNLRRGKFTEKTGPTYKLDTPYDAFTAIWDKKFILLIVKETNKNAQRVIEAMKKSKNVAPSFRFTNWNDTTVDEMYIYLAIVMALGICIKSKLREYWTCSGNITDTPNFAPYMTYHRFLILCKCLHFGDNVETQQLFAQNVQNRSEIKIAKIAPVIIHLNKKFQMLYRLSQDIVIDESLNKSAADDIKTYELCDSKNGYIWRFEVKTGVQDASTEECYQLSPFPMSEKITTLILNMIKGLEHTKRTIWMNSHYTSPALARTLKSLGFDCVGTLSANCKFFSNLQLRPEEISGCTSGDVDIIVWQGRDRVSIISTYHGNASKNHNTKNQKTSKIPLAVLDYNICMSEVDHKDQLLAAYPIEKKCSNVWYKKYFRRLLNVSITNSYILLKESVSPSSKLSEYMNEDYRQFRVTLVESLLKEHMALPSILNSLSYVTKFKSAGRINVPVFSASIKRHLPKQYDVYPGAKSERKRETCLVCQKRTEHYCPGCNVPLCAFSSKGNSCHEKHHSYKE